MIVAAHNQPKANPQAGVKNVVRRVRKAASTAGKVHKVNVDRMDKQARDDVAFVRAFLDSAKNGGKLPGHPNDYSLHDDVAAALQESFDDDSDP